MTSTPIPSNAGRVIATALAAAGYPDLESLAGRSRRALLAIHGVGRVGLARVEAAMVAQGLALRD